MGWYENRLSRVKEEAQKIGVDALVIFKPQNTYYLTLFNAIIYSRPVILFVPLRGEPVLIVPRLRVGHAQEESRVTDIRMYHNTRIGAVAPGVAADPIQLLKDVLTQNGMATARVGLERDYLTLQVADELTGALPGVVPVDVSPLFRSLRVVKDQEEIAMIRRAAEIADVGLAAALDSVRVGTTEIDVSVAAMRAMNEHWRARYPDLEVADFGDREGGVANSLWCYCLSGERIGYGCESPSARKLEKGDIAFLVVLTTVNGYHAENERTVVLGKPTSRQLRVLNAHLEAYHAAMDKIRPGVRCSEVAGAAAAVLERYGYSASAHARAGHSIGLSAHEDPSFAIGEETVLKEGMVMSVEPSIDVKGIAHAGIANIGLVSAHGFELLTRHRPTELISV